MYYCSTIDVLLIVVMMMSVLIVVKSSIRNVDLRKVRLENKTICKMTSQSENNCISCVLESVLFLAVVCCGLLVQEGFDCSDRRLSLGKSQTYVDSYHGASRKIVTLSTQEQVPETML